MSYSPAIGTWLEKDPTGSAYIDGPNLYQFARDNPITKMDPLGTNTLPVLYAINKDPFNYHNNLNNKASPYDPDFNLNWLVPDYPASAKWSLTQLIPGDPPGLAFLSAQGGNWVSLNPGVPCFWRVNKKILTERHTLSVPSLGEYGGDGNNTPQIAAAIAAIMAIENRHEDAVVGFYQEEFSPNYVTTSKNYEQELTREWNKRMAKANQDVQSIENADVSAIHTLLEQILILEQPS